MQGPVAGHDKGTCCQWSPLFISSIRGRAFEDAGGEGAENRASTPPTSQRKPPNEVAFTPVATGTGDQVRPRFELKVATSATMGSWLPGRTSNAAKMYWPFWLRASSLHSWSAGSWYAPVVTIEAIAPFIGAR